MGKATTNNLASVWFVIFLGYIIVLILTSCVSQAEKKTLAEHYIELGNNYMELKKYDKAATAYSRAIELDSENIGGAYNYARALIETGKYEEAINLLVKLTKQDPENTLFLTALAYAYYRAGRNEEAITTYSKVVMLRYNDEVSTANLCILLEHAGRYEEVVLYYQSLIAISDAPDMYRLKLGEVYYKLNKIDEARAELDNYTAAKPDDGAGIKLLVKILEKQGMRDDALARIESYVLKVQNDAEALFMFARLQFLAGKLQEGLESLGKALKAGYNDKKSLAELLELKETASIGEDIKKLIEENQPAK